MNRYSGNFAKGLFLSSGNALISAVIVWFIYLISSEDLNQLGMIFLVALFSSWFFLFMSGWKRIEVEDMKITVYRFSRTPVIFSIRENLIAFHAKEHTLFGVLTLYISPSIRVIDRNSNITDIRCPHFTEKDIERLRDDIRRMQY